MSPSLCVQYSNINLDRMREAERRGEGAGQLWFRYRDEIPLDEYHIVGVSEYGSGSGSGNLGHIYGVDATDERDVTRGYVEGRRVAEIIYNFYRRRVPGYEYADLTATAALLGVARKPPDLRRLPALLCGLSGAPPFLRTISAASAIRWTFTPPLPMPPGRNGSPNGCAKPLTSPAKTTASPTGR